MKLCSTFVLVIIKQATMTTLENTIEQLIEGLNINPITRKELINVTKEIKGANFASFLYSSKQSNGTELAQYIVNLGISYTNALSKDIETLTNFDIANVDLSKIPFAGINTKKLTREEYTLAVKNSLEQAKNELLDSLNKSFNKTSEQRKEEAQSKGIFALDNKGIVKYYAGTNNINIFALLVSKSTKHEGTFKVVAKGAKTCAKELITKQSNLRSGKFRNFTFDGENLVTAKIKGLQVAPK